jgi:hypothetical protein
MSIVSPAPSTDDLVDHIDRFLQELVTGLEPGEEPGTMGRPRILPSLCLWGGLLVCVLRGFSSQLELWRLLSQRGLWDYPRFPVSDQAVYQRLANGGTAPMEHLFSQVTALLAERLAPYAPTDLAPFAQEVAVLDASTLDPIARTLPSLRGVPNGDPTLLPGQVAGVFDVRRQLWRTIRFVPEPQQNEKVLARELLATVPVGSLVLTDLGYFGFEWFDDLSDGGYFWLSRLRAKTSLSEPIHTFYEDGETRDVLVWLGAHRADCAKHAVRLVEFRYHGVLHRYLTNVRDPQQCSLQDIATLYARRWDIELAVKLVKRELNLHLLWSAKAVVIQQQLWATLIIAQILQALRLEIAGRAGVDPFDVSLPLLVQELRWSARDGTDPIAFLVAHGVAMRVIRPSRRIRIVTPPLDPTHLARLPSHLVCQRTPRYAHRQCGPR